MSRILAPLAAAIIVTLLAAGSAAAHEGHDHGQEAPAVSAAASPRVQATSGPFELVAILDGAELAIYLDRADTNAPVAGATITLETAAGPVTAQGKDGLYRTAAPWAKAGAHDLLFTVTADGASEVLLGTLRVPEAAATAADGGTGGALAAARDLGRRLGDRSGLLMALAGFGAGILTMALARRQRRPKVAALVLAALFLGAVGNARTHEGEEHATPPTAAATRDLAQRLPDGALFVPKPIQRILAVRTVVTKQATHRKSVALPGRIIPDPGASGFVQASVSGRLAPPPQGFPRLGTVVKAGDVLALVTPPLQAIDVSDMRQKAGELDQQIAIVERRIARYEPLVKSGATAKTILDEAILELRGLQERRASLDKVRREPEQLIAPVSGVIGAANAVAGQIAETNAVVFQIIDPARMWVEGLTFAAIPDAQAATARTGEGRTLALAFRGAGLTDRSQAIPVHFAIEGDAKGLRVGQLVTVLAQTGEAAEGLALPRTSVLRGANGQTIVFEHTDAERFEARAVRVEPLDGDRVLVMAGLAPGKRVVVQGAELLNQIR